MPNKKSSKQTAPFPPLLNLAQDRPHVDSSFQNWEKQNGPLVNGMITPVFIKDLEQRAIFDYIGNEYDVIDGYLVKNKTERLFPVVEEHFERDEVSFRKYLAYDIDNSYTLESENPTAYAILDDDNNSIEFHYKDASLVTTSIFTEATIIASRIRIVDNSAILVVYYDEANVGKILYIRLNENGSSYNTTFNASWRRQRCRYLTSTSYVSKTVSKTITNANPFIQITGVNGGIGVSLVSNFGRLLNSVDTAFITFVEQDSKIFQYGTSLVPENSSQTAEVTSEYSTYFRLYNRNTVNSNIGAAFLKKDDHYYEYTEEGVVGPEIDFPTTYQPVVTQEDYIEIDSVMYDYGTYTYTLVQSDLHCNNTQGDSMWSVKATWNGVEYESDQQAAGTTSCVIQASIKVYRGQTYETTWSNAVITWNNEEYEFNDSWINKGNQLFTRTETTTTTISYLVAPNVFLDNGKMYSLWYFNANISSSWSNSGTADGVNYYQMSQGSSIVESAEIASISVSGSTATYKFTPLSYHVVGSANIPRSNGFCVGQNFWQSWVKLNTSGATTPAGLASNSAETSSATFQEYMNSNETDLVYQPGSCVITSGSSYYLNYYAAAAGNTLYPTEDAVACVPGGFRCQIGKTNWRLLYNVFTTGLANLQSISYTPSLHQMGTLVAPWSSIDEDHYIVANDKILIYRNQDGVYYRIAVKENYVLTTIVEDRYILINTTGYWNMYDSKLRKPFHYATDYNGRAFLGSTYSTPGTGPAAQAGNIYRLRAFGTAINGAYNTHPRYTVSSILIPTFSLRRVGVVTNVHIYDCVCPESQDVQPIDIYYSDENLTTSVPYRYTIMPFLKQSQYQNYDLDGQTYNISSGYYSPNIFTVYINGQGNHDGVIEGDSNYVLVYQDNVVQPQLLYTANSETIDQTAFFVLQGQFYGVLDDKIYSLVYVNGVITERDAIVDIRGLQFIGNNPMIAFFWSPSLRSIYSFTGDANLEHLYDSSKFSEVLNDKSTYWYDESTQSIWVPTNRGLLVLGPKNTYFFEDWNKTTNVQISRDGITHITDNDTTYNLSYYPREGYSPKKLDVETSFWGPGSTEVGSIDRFGITLYNMDETHPSTDVVVGTRTLTDITVKSEEKKIHITPEMWDKWSHSVLINFNPKLIQGQGIRLYVKTDQAIQQITTHTQDRATTQLSHANV